MTPPIFGLTLTHPWPVCIRDLGKDVENRTWHPKKWGGCVGMYLAIHGGKPPPKLDGTSEKALDFQGDVNWVARNIVNAGHLPDTMTEERLRPFTEKLHGIDVLRHAAFVLPGIVAICHVPSVATGSTSPWAAMGQYQWTLARVLPIEPIPYTGGRGLWKIEERTVNLLRAKWAEANDGEVVF